MKPRRAADALSFEARDIIKSFTFGPLEGKHFIHFTASIETVVEINKMRTHSVSSSLIIYVLPTIVVYAQLAIAAVSPQLSTPCDEH